MPHILAVLLQSTLYIICRCYYATFLFVHKFRISFFFNSLYVALFRIVCVPELRCNASERRLWPGPFLYDEYDYYIYNYS